MDPLYRIEHDGHPTHALRRDGTWHVLEGDPFGRYTAGARVVGPEPRVLAPVVLAIVFLGAYQGAHAWGDLHALIAFGVLGWVMKRLRWPRPPLLLGFVLGEVVEGYLFISFQLYEWAWMLRPIVLAALAVALYGVVRHAMRQRGARRASATGEAPPRRRVAAGDPDETTESRERGVGLKHAAQHVVGVTRFVRQVHGDSPGDQFD